MLITTSRKPSNRTRTFCQSLSRALNSRYINRGKMSMRNILLKVNELGFSNLLIISEKNGNPNTLTFYNHEGEQLIILEVSVALKNIRTNINHEKLSINCQIDELRDIIPIFDLPETESLDTNTLIIKKQSNTKAVMEFIDDKGLTTNPLIYIHDWRIG
ncbi:MAG: Brix domain-containing protein [Methanobacteriaceae archaeon]|nr:Brix domain-containing protein [Methanobacteriaceae archaeon]